MLRVRGSKEVRREGNMLKGGEKEELMVGKMAGREGKYVMKGGRERTVEGKYEGKKGEKRWGEGSRGRHVEVDKKGGKNIDGRGGRRYA